MKKPMADTFQMAINGFISGFFGILLALFIFQATRRKRPAPHFLVLLTCGFVGGIFAFLESAELPALRAYRGLLLSAQLSFYGLQFFFFFVFLENLVGARVHTIRLVVALGFLLLQVVSLWLIVWFQDTGVTSDLWLLADIGYDGLALYVFLGRGVPIYAKTYRFTKEKRPLLMAVALLVVGLGFVIITLVDQFSYWATVPPGLEAVRDLGEILPMTGLFLFLLAYLTNVDYLYRLPNDVFLLLVLHNSGIAMHSVRFRTRAQVEIDEMLFSGMISAIKSVFNELFRFKPDLNIRTITSEGLYVLIDSGPKISTIVVSDQLSYFLDKSLKRYRREFEREFTEQIDSGVDEVSQFNHATTLLPEIFPYLVVEEVGLTKGQGKEALAAAASPQKSAE